MQTHFDHNSTVQSLWDEFFSRGCLSQRGIVTRSQDRAEVQLLARYRGRGSKDSVQRPVSSVAALRLLEGSEAAPATRCKRGKPADTLADDGREIRHAALLHLMRTEV